MEFWLPFLSLSLFFKYWTQSNSWYLVVIFPTAVIVYLHDSDDHPGSLLSLLRASFWHSTEAIWRQCLVAAPEANVQTLSGACLSFRGRWLNDTCLPTVVGSSQLIQCGAQRKLIRTLGNDRVNTRSLFLMIFSITEDFSLSHACLSFFFQIARKDINNNNSKMGGGDSLKRGSWSGMETLGSSLPVLQLKGQAKPASHNRLRSQKFPSQMIRIV